MRSTEGGSGEEMVMGEEDMRARELGFDDGDLGEGGSIGSSKGPKGFKYVCIGGIPFSEG